MTVRNQHGLEAPARVPPYLVTNGRTRPKRHLSMMDFIVATTPGPENTFSLNHRTLLKIVTRERHGVAVAEAAALLHQPCGVISILAGDLVEAHAVRITSAPPPPNTGVSVDVLQRILEGLKTRL